MKKKLHRLIQQNLTYKILNGQSPTYLTSPVCSLRSSDRLLLQVANVSTAIYGQRTFSFYTPKLWKTLPQTIKQAETVAILKKLETLLFL